MNTILKTLVGILLLSLISTGLTAQETNSIIIEDGRVTIKRDTTEFIIENRRSKNNEVDTDEEIEEESGDIGESINEAVEEAIEDVEDAIEEIEEEVERIFQDENGVIEDDDEMSYEDDNHDHKHSHSKKKRKRKNKFRVGMLDYGVSSYLFDELLGAQSPYEQFALNQGRSHNLNLHIFRHRINILAETLFFEYGASINWRRYNLENDVIFNPDPVDIGNGTRGLTFTDSAIDNKKNKLRTSYLEVPVMITINPRDSKFFISGGAYGGMRIGASQKLKSKDEGKTVIKGDYGLRDFNYGVVGRLGFGPIDFYCQYSLVPMFEDDVLPADVAPITFGISMLGF